MSANTTISFSTSGTSDDQFTIELDTDRNNDKSTFSYGNKAYFRVYSTIADLNSLIVKATAGTIAKEGIYTADRDAADVSFIDSQTSDYSYAINGVSSYSWYGQSLGAITKYDDTTIQCEIEPDPENGILGIASVVVSASYALYSITVPKQSQSEFPVVVYVGA